jgi:hypothetical protein
MTQIFSFVAGVSAAIPGIFVRVRGFPDIASLIRATKLAQVVEELTGWALHNLTLATL